MDPDFWNNAGNAELLLKELKGNKKWVENYLRIQSEIEDLEVLYDFQKDGEGTEEQVDEAYQKVIDMIEDVEFRSTLNKSYRKIHFRKYLL